MFTQLALSSLAMPSSASIPVPVLVPEARAAAAVDGFTRASNASAADNDGASRDAPARHRAINSRITTALSSVSVI